MRISEVCSTPIVPVAIDDDMLPQCNDSSDDDDDCREMSPLLTQPPPSTEDDDSTQPPPSTQDCEPSQPPPSTRDCEGTQPPPSTQNDDAVPKPRPSTVEVGVYEMPEHLRDKDSEWTANEMRQHHKGESIAIINRLRNKPVSKSRLHIPICRLFPYEKVRPIDDHEVEKMMNEFTMGYREGDRVLYVSVYSSKGKQKPVTPDDAFLYNSHWKAVNDAFEKTLVADPDLHQFSDRHFYVYDGNHRATAWRRAIEQLHPDDPAWYISVDCIILDVREQKHVVVNAMHDINW